MLNAAQDESIWPWLHRVANLNGSSADHIKQPLDGVQTHLKVATIRKCDQVYGASICQQWEGQGWCWDRLIVVSKIEANTYMDSLKRELSKESYIFSKGKKITNDQIEK